MKYEKRFIQLIQELREKDFYATRHVDVVFKGKVYKLVVSAMEFGQRVELTGKEDEYIVFVYGIEGLDEKGVLHKKNEQDLVKIVRRLTDDIRAELIGTEEQTEELLMGPPLPRRVYIPRTLERTRTNEQTKQLIDRLLDRYNDYTCLDALFGETDTRYQRKAKKLLHLMKQASTTNKKSFGKNG